MTVRKLGGVLVCLAIVGMASADVLLTNLPGNDGTQSALIGAGRIKAMGFTMPAGDDYFLDDVTLRLDIPTALPDPLIRIFSNVGGLPGAELATLADPALSPGIGNFAFTPAAPFTLTAGETYWVVVWSQTGTFDWKANSPGITPTGLATHFGSLFSSTSGPNPPTSNSSILNSYAVNGTIVPEPATLSLLALVGVALLRRR